MAASLNISFILFLLTLLSIQNIHARESQFFNKIPSNNINSNNLANENQLKEEDPLDKLEQEPNFIPENQNAGYGLYGHESGQLPPSTTTPTTTDTNLPFKNQPNEFVPKYLPKNYNTEAYVTPATSNTEIPFNNEPNEFEPKYLPKNYNTEAYVTPTTSTTNFPFINEPNELASKYLPKNYNTESYVTEPEGYHSSQETNTNNYYNTDNENYQNPKQDYPATTTAANGDHYDQNYAGNSYNSQNQGLNQYSLGQKGYITASSGGNFKNYNAADKQGMSDTRFLENGKYFYDLSLEKNDRYPFDNTRRFGDQYRKYGGSYGNNNENTYELNKYTNYGFENKGEHLQDFQDDEDLP